MQRTTTRLQLLRDVLARPRALPAAPKLFEEMRTRHGAIFGDQWSVDAPSRWVWRHCRHGHVTTVTWQSAEHDGKSVRHCLSDIVVHRRSLSGCFCRRLVAHACTVPCRTTVIRRPIVTTPSVVCRLLSVTLAKRRNVSTFWRISALSWKSGILCKRLGRKGS